MDSAAFLAGLVAIVTTVFNTIIGTLRSAYNASHKWFAIGCVIFLGLVWFGYAHFRVPAHDDELAAQIAALSKKIDALSVPNKAAPLSSVVVTDPKRFVKK